MNVMLIDSNVDKTVWEICLSIAQSISQSVAQSKTVNQPWVCLSVTQPQSVQASKITIITLTLILLLVTSQVKQNNYLID